MQSVFKIGIQAVYSALNGPTLQLTHRFFENVVGMVIDEFSMLKSYELKFVNLRLE